MIATIDDLRNYLRVGQLNSSDILSVMTVLRIQIETDKQKGKYQWLNLFANWCVHPRISKSNLAIDIFKAFYGALGNFDITQSQSIKDFYEYIFDKLREDMKSVFKLNDIPTGLVDDDRAFCGLLIGILLIVKDRPIQLPEKLNNSQKNELNKIGKLLKFFDKRPDIDLTPISLSVKHIDDGTFGCFLTTQGAKDGRLNFNLSPIGYKDIKLSFLMEV